MSTPLKGNKLYPDISESLLLSGTKRKGGQRSVEKENEGNDQDVKKIKVDKERKSREQNNVLSGCSFLIVPSNCLNCWGINSMSQGMEG